MQDKLLQLDLESLRLGLVSSLKYMNRPILVFNSASFCGFTKQIYDMQKVYEAGSVVPMALPTNEFGKQEPGDDIEISQYLQQLSFINSSRISEQIGITNLLTGQLHCLQHI